MRVLTQTDFLELWESAQTLHPIDWGILAIHTAFPEARAEVVADWPLGRRNRMLAELRCNAIGDTLRGWTTCHGCPEKLEFEVDGRALANTPAANGDTSVSAIGLSFRLPTSRDLAALAADPATETDPGEAARRLLARCRLESVPRTDVRAADDPGAPLDGPRIVSGFASVPWSESELELVGEVMASADPLAEITLDFACPSCDTRFQENLDLASFLWTEVESRAKRLLADVHVLASSYGWSETSILNLPAARRAFYLDLVHA